MRRQDQRVSISFMYRCPNCQFAVEAWDDGNPYIRDDDGVRHFCYHPQREGIIREIVEKSRWAAGKTEAEIEAELPNYLGWMMDALCVDCGETSKIDDEETSKRCEHCGSVNVRDVNKIGGLKCPKCGQGALEKYSDFYSIS